MIPEPQALNKVKEFHELFDSYIGSKPAIPEANIANFRVNILQEELNELKTAIENNDIVEAADALADLQYVLS